MERLKIIRDKIKKFLKNLQKHNVSEYSAQCAYYIVLSFIPFIIILLTLIQYMGIDKEILFIIIKTIIPQTMNETILGIIQEVYSKSIGTISLSLLFVGWSAGKGFYSLCKGLQVVYEKKKKNTYISLKLKSILYIFVFSALIIATLVLMVFGKTINNFLNDKFNNINILGFVFYIRNIVITIILFFYLMIIYKFIPSNKNKFKDQIPGAIIATLGWVAVSKIFSVYLNLFESFSIMYGSLTTIILIMMWVYLCMFIVLIGAEINSMIIKAKRENEKKQ